MIQCWSCDYTKCTDFEVKLVLRNIMNVVKIRLFQYIHSNQHSFHSFDVTFIVCKGKEFLHNLVEMIICMSLLSWMLPKTEHYEHPCLFSQSETCFWCLFIGSFQFWIITYIWADTEKLNDFSLYLLIWM